MPRRRAKTRIYRHCEERSDDPSTLAAQVSQDASPPKRKSAKAEAIQSSARDSGLLRYARNDARHNFASSQHRSRPSFARSCPPTNRGRRESRVLAAPAALRAKLKQAHKRSHYRYNRINPAFPAQWFYGLLRDLPGGAGLLSPSPARYFPADLTPASRRQDHTTSPYALAFSSGANAPDTKASIASRAQRS